MKKPILITILIIMCCLALCAAAFAAGSSYTKQLTANYVGISLVVHGETVTPKDANGNTVDPFIVDGTTYLPVRAVAEALGEEVSWDGTTKTIYIGEKPEQPPAPIPEPQEEAEIKLDQIAFSLYEGESKQVTATVAPQGTPVAWSSSNPAVATVDANGLVTALSAGKIDIYAVAGSVQTFCTVTVMPCTIALDQIAFSLDVGETKQVTATVMPQGTPVTWSSNNPSVATVDSNGLITALSAGKIDIYASVGSSKTFCTVTVFKRESIVVGYTWVYIDSAQGVEPCMYWRNNSGKTIKYITFTVTPYNAVDDVVASTIGNKKTCDIRITGPIESFDIDKMLSIPYIDEYYNTDYILCRSIKSVTGFDGPEYIRKDKETGALYCGRLFNLAINDELKYKEAYFIDESDYKYICDQTAYWDPVWYNSTIVRYTIDKVFVEYMDGSTETITSPSVLMP